MNLLDLFVKIGVKDETDGKLDNIKNKIGNGLKTAAKVGGAALAATTAAVGALAKASIDQYADYEQLVGGVKKLYGESAKTVVDNSTKAFRTAGMSANEYMQSVTSMSAALINDVGGSAEEAARIADMAMQDIADNANTFGTYTAQDLTQVYKNLAKEQYQMLDNLNLGVGGTKEGMQELIKRANDYKVSIGEAGDLSMSSFADQIEAIHIVQQQLNITGTTAKEASTTISGSLGMVKSAWTNLLTGMSGGTEEFALNQQELMQNLIDSIVGFTDETGNHVNGFLDNLLPIISATLQGIVELISGASGFLPQLLTTIIEILPQFIDAGLQIIMSLMEGLLQNADKIAHAVREVIYMLIQFFTEHTQEIVSLGIEIITALVIGLAEAIPQIMAAVPQIIGAFWSAVIDNLPVILQAGVTVVEQFIVGLMARLAGIGAAAENIVQSIRNVISGLGGEAWAWGSDLIVNFINGITAWFGELINRVSSIAQTVRNYLGFSEPKLGPLSNFHTYAPDMMKLFAEGITDNADLISDAFNNSLDIGTSEVTQPQRNGVSGVFGGVGDIVLNITSEIDGAALARNTYRYNAAEQQRHGVSYA